ncbi:MAG: hypothetical protein J3Q66DRAFT_437197 [Benniella sp.]|nr:MAG: hypothetical protein J3Q66DRAFT_437197 [Benniella sp.]
MLSRLSGFFKSIRNRILKKLRSRQRNPTPQFHTDTCPDPDAAIKKHLGKVVRHMEWLYDRIENFIGSEEEDPTDRLDITKEKQEWDQLKPQIEQTLNDHGEISEIPEGIDATSIHVHLREICEEYPSNVWPSTLKSGTWGFIPKYASAHDRLEVWLRLVDEAAQVRDGLDGMLLENVDDNQDDNQDCQQGDHQDVDMEKAQ